MNLKSALKSLFVYYVKAVIFAAVMYGLLLVLYGPVRFSFFEWLVIIVLAFTVGYIPDFIRLFRGGSGAAKR